MDRQPWQMTKPDAPTEPDPAQRTHARAADPCAMVIFGADGDMTKRLLIPALYNLSRTNLLPEKFALIGVDIAKETKESWRAASLRDVEGGRRRAR